MIQTINYYEYIQSPEWYERTKDIRLRNKYRCECCNLRFGEAVHHRTYERLGVEIPEDLLHICDGCHKMIHGIIPIGSYFVWPSRLAFLSQLRKEVIENECRLSH